MNTILQINFLEKTGGAARIAWTLHHAYRALGLNSLMAVGNKESDDAFVYTIPNAENRALLSKGLLSLHHQMKKKEIFISGKKMSRIPYRLAYLDAWIQERLGLENYQFPGTQKIVEMIQIEPDIIHLHNLHPNYFDLRALPQLSKNKPIVLTLHDCWLMTGHCAYFLDCERWQTGCGQCPYPEITHPVRRDHTAINWKRKQAALSKVKLNIITPSAWLMNIVEGSLLQSSINHRQVINNGINLEIFHPAEKTTIRHELNLPLETTILLFVVSGDMQKHSFKDYGTIERAIAEIVSTHPQKKILFLGLGHQAPTKQIGNIELRFLPYAKSMQSVAKYYQAADIYLHAAKADNFPNVILESLACGTPVIATAVGGIPEQIIDGETGFLVPQGDASAMAKHILGILENPTLYKLMTVNAAQDARKRFNAIMMVDNYIKFYKALSP